MYINRQPSVQKQIFECFNINGDSGYFRNVSRFIDKSDPSQTLKSKTIIGFKYLRPW